MVVAEINALDSGSTGKIMLQIADVARASGIEVYTYSSSRMSNHSAGDKHIYIDRYLDYRPHMILGMLTGYETSFSYIATKRLIKKLKEISPDIIHLHITHGWYLNHNLLFDYMSKNSIRVIWTLHDCWTFTGRCPHFQLTGCDRWKTGCHDCVYPKRNYPASYWFDKSKRQWKKKKKMFTSVKDMTIVTPSKWLADLVKQSYLQKYPVRVINNGIDLNTFKPTPGRFREKRKLEDKYIILGVAANWGQRKGLDVFIKLTESLPEKYRIVLVGTDEVVDKLLPERIISIHRTADQQELAELYTAADVFANPTREDTFPTVNMEALACGTPIVTFRTGGSTEIVDPSCGTVVDCNDYEAFEKEIRRVCEEKLFSSDACIKASEKYDKYARFKDYIELYKEIAGN